MALAQRRPEHEANIPQISGPENNSERQSTASVETMPQPVEGYEEFRDRFKPVEKKLFSEIRIGDVYLVKHPDGTVECLQVRDMTYEEENGTVRNGDINTEIATAKKKVSKADGVVNELRLEKTRSIVQANGRQTTNAESANIDNAIATVEAERKRSQEFLDTHQDPKLQYLYYDTYTPAEGQPGKRDYIRSNPKSEIRGYRRMSAAELSACGVQKLMGTYGYGTAPKNKDTENRLFLGGNAKGTGEIPPNYYDKAA